jgi:CubicO group peptidase (beta-lactamase class C family)
VWQVRNGPFNAISSRPVKAPDLAAVPALLKAGIDAGWHECAQCYVSIAGQTVLDIAVGESRPGRPLRPDDVMLWYSSGKPFTTVAILQQWERGLVDLDDRVGRFVPEWGSGKERATIRHLLTHTAGFPMFRVDPFDRDVSYEESVRRVAAAPAEWEPGTAAAYHASSAWRILGAIVQAVDGRPIGTYLHDEVIAPLALEDTYLGIPPDEQARLGDRIVPVSWKGHMLPKIDPDGGLLMAPYRVDEVHNESWHIAKVEPGGGMRGPSRALGRFYESLLGYGPAVLEPRTVEVMRAVHRFGMKDGVLGRRTPWGLGVQVDFSGGTTRRAFGHGGMASSRGLADPECGLTLAVVANGLPGFVAAEQRVLEITDAVYTALGDDIAPMRKPVQDLARAFGLST